MSHFEEFPLADAQDNEIILQRNAHFGGQFPLMLEYYARGGKGVLDEISITRIEELYSIERSSGEDLSQALLSEADLEKEERVHEAYQVLRDLYENPEAINTPALLIADLILTEEEEAEAEIEAIVFKGKEMVEPLIALLNSDEFSDPLYPGYGYGPSLAARCLGKINDERALMPLFEALPCTDFADEGVVLQALTALGTPAKEFLLKTLRSRPWTLDNERAAMALTSFALDPEVGAICLEQLNDPAIAKKEPLSHYLALTCEGLKSEELRNAFKELMNAPNISPSLKQEMAFVVKAWR